MAQEINKQKIEETIKKETIYLPKEYFDIWTTSSGAGYRLKEEHKLKEKEMGAKIKPEGWWEEI